MSEAPSRACQLTEPLLSPSEDVFHLVDAGNADRISLSQPWLLQLPRPRPPVSCPRELCSAHQDVLVAVNDPPIPSRVRRRSEPSGT